MLKCVSFLRDLYLLMHQKKEEGDFPFGVEDLLYYVKRVEEQQFNLDFGALKQYFPVDLVMSGILKICQDLFGNHTTLYRLSWVFHLTYHLSYLQSVIAHAGLRFEEIVDAEVWHSDVQLYSVYDLSSSELLGYFYLDMFARFISY